MEHKADFDKWKSRKRQVPKKRSHSKLSRKPRKERFTTEDFLNKYKEFNINEAESFKDYPFSDRTKNGLIKSNFLTPTAIQKAAILPALKGRDILASAKTGSGKTLAFLIPLLENLFVHKWNAEFGAAALVISPTRELAYQTFKVLRNVGHKHDFSAGLLIGGKSMEDEAKHIHKTNILICTPGRILHHMDQTHAFTTENIKLIVLDEADKLLEMGFEKSLNAILENIPKDRQTLLFSATQTKSIKSLARLALRDPAYISVSSDALHCTPNTLKQRYMVCELQDKINLIYSFIKNHLKCKILVFMSSCKQVKFYYTAFCRLRPGIPVMNLHGGMKQERRRRIYEEFCRKTQKALLFATDVAARGLDFPGIDWVVQLDCPEDAQTYIHRAGRTARLQEKGNGLLVLLPHEEKGMIAELEKHRVPMDKSEINPNKLTQIGSRMQSLCAEDHELKESAQRCFVAYVKSVRMMKNKRIFDVRKLPFNEFAASLGLAMTPRVRSLEKLGITNKALVPTPSPAPVIDLSSTSTAPAALSKPITEAGFDFNAVESDDDDDFMKVKTTDVFVGKELDAVVPSDKVAESEAAKSAKARSQAAEAKRLLRKGGLINQKIIFDDEGDVKEVWPPVGPLAGDADELEGGIDVERAQEIMRARDLKDKEKHREQIRQKHKERRMKDKRERLGLTKEEMEEGVDGEEEVVAYLGSPDEDETSSEVEYSDDDEEEDSEAEDDDSESADEEDDSEEEEPAVKRAKFNKEMNMKTTVTATSLMENAKMSLQEEENLLLHLLERERENK